MILEAAAPGHNSFLELKWAVKFPGYRPPDEINTRFWSNN